MHRLASITQNPKASPLVLVTLAKAIELYVKDDSSADEFLNEIVRHPNFPAKELENYLANPPTSLTLYGCISNPKLSQARLAELAQKEEFLFEDDPDATGWCLAKICENPNASPETLKYIVERKDVFSAIVSAHPINHWPDYLQFLCEGLQNNPNTPPEVAYLIDRLYTDPS